MTEIKQMGRPAISDKDRAIYDKKRSAVVKRLPKQYMPKIDEYCIDNNIDKIPAQRVHNFVYGVTYNQDLLKTLQGFIESLKNN